MNSGHKNIEALFRVHFEALHRYAFTILKDSDAAKDVVQAVFLKLLEKGNAIQIEHSEKSYLFRSVFNQCMNRIKREDALAARHQKYMNAQQELAETPLYDNNSHQEIKEKIDGVLNQLPPQCRNVFIQSRVKQKKYKEIADDLGISVKTVEAHMGKALKLIRNAVGVLIVIFCLLIEWKHKL